MPLNVKAGAVGGLPPRSTFVQVVPGLPRSSCGATPLACGAAPGRTRSPSSTPQTAPGEHPPAHGLANAAGHLRLHQPSNHHGGRHQLRAAHWLVPFRFHPGGRQPGLHPGARRGRRERDWRCWWAGRHRAVRGLPCTVDNAAGYIFGGGGGGGGAYVYNNNGDGVRAGGGGGAGADGGAAGASAANWANGSNKSITRQAAAGTQSTGGVGAIGAFVPNIINAYAYGGSGGGPGTAGAAGSIDIGKGGTSPNGYGAGGAAGAAILKNGLAVTVTAGNNTTQIKGAIV